jgi:hypothetical protein
MGGHFTALESQTLVVGIRLPNDADVAAVINRAVVAGLESVPVSERPSGLLKVWWFTLHEVDFKTWAWSRAAATMCRLLCADLTGMPDEQASRVAAEYAAYRP